MRHQSLVAFVCASESGSERQRAERTCERANVQTSEREEEGEMGGREDDVELTTNEMNEPSSDTLGVWAYWGWSER